MVPYALTSHTLSEALELSEIRANKDKDLADDTHETLISVVDGIQDTLATIDGFLIESPDKAA